MAATTTARPRFSSGSARSMNSRTSRPRSPTRPITIASASQLRARADSSIVLPAPGGPKMPRRCPRPMEVKASMARMPVSIRVDIKGRVTASGGGIRTARLPVPVRGPSPSIGRPRPSMTRPSRPSPTTTRHASSTSETVTPNRRPRIPPNGLSRAVFPWIPMTSAKALSGPCNRQIPPSGACSMTAWTTGPRTSRIQPIRRRRPFLRMAAVMSSNLAAIGSVSAGALPAAGIVMSRCRRLPGTAPIGAVADATSRIASSTTRPAHRNPT